MSDSGSAVASELSKTSTVRKNPRRAIFPGGRCTKYLAKQQDYSMERASWEPRETVDEKTIRECHVRVADSDVDFEKRSESSNELEEKKNCKKIERRRKRLGTEDEQLPPESNDIKESGKGDIAGDGVNAGEDEDVDSDAPLKKKTRPNTTQGSSKEYTGKSSGKRGRRAAITNFGRGRVKAVVRRKIPVNYTEIFDDPDEESSTEGEAKLDEGSTKNRNKNKVATKAVDKGAVGKKTVNKKPADKIVVEKKAVEKKAVSKKPVEKIPGKRLASKKPAANDDDSEESSQDGGAKGVVNGGRLRRVSKCPAVLNSTTSRKTAHS